MTLEGRTAIVTGAAGSGMGRSIALTLAREGAKVAVNYKTSREMAEKVAEHIQKDGGSAIALQADIFTLTDCQALVDETVKAFGQIDICIVGPGADWHPEPIDKLDSAAALADLHQEVAPLYYLMPLVLPGMYARKWGRIIGLTLHPTKLPPAYAYNASKAARSSALQLTQEQAWANGVTVNMLAPGPITGISSLEVAVEQCSHGAAWENRENVSPQDIAEGVAFLCSEAGRFVTGCTIPYWFIK